MRPWSSHTARWVSFDVIQRMRDQQQRAAIGEVTLHPRDAFVLERFIAHREHFVGDQQIGLQRRHQREAETHHHAAGVGLDRRVNVLADVGEGDDLVEPGVERRAGQPLQRSSEFEVFAAGVFRMKAGAELEQRAHRAGAVGTTGRRLHTPAMIFSSVDLPAPFLAHQRQRLPATHREIDVGERHETVRPPAAPAADAQDAATPAPWRPIRG